MRSRLSASDNRSIPVPVSLEVERKYYELRNQIVGSELIGQKFKSPKYFHGRPSATDPAYNASASRGSNSGPSNAKFLRRGQEAH